MAQFITLEITTPEGVVLGVEVAELTAPSVDGEFGVLPDHRPLLAALRTGIVSYKADGSEHRVAVGNGFVEIAENKAVILTDRFTTKAAVDPVRARLDLKEADAALDRFAGEPGTLEHSELVAREQWAAVELELYGDPPPPTVRTFYEHESSAHGRYGSELAETEAGEPHARSE